MGQFSSLSFLRVPVVLLFPLAVILLPIKNFGQTLSDPVNSSTFSDSTHTHSTEDLFGLIDFEKFKREVQSALKMNATDADLFFMFIRQKWDQDDLDFFSKADQGLINESNLFNYLEGRKQAYINLYPDFLANKLEFARKVSSIQNSILAANGPCVNEGFEDGTLNGWKPSDAKACQSPTPCNVNFLTSTRIKVVNKSMTDPYIPTLSVVDPTGGNFSVRMEDYQNGGNASIMRQIFNVSATNNIFTYRYAAVLEDPQKDHLDSERPYFKVRMYDQNGDIIPCATYTVIAKPPIENFTHVTLPVPKNQPVQRNDPFMELYYRDWTTVSIPLVNYVGQNVTVEFIVSDCSKGGHMGYVYLDAKCSALPIISTQTICQNQPVKITAPSNFASYNWTGPGIVGSSTQQQMTANKAGSYSVLLTPFTDLYPCPAKLNFDIIENCKPNPIKVSLCEDVSQTLISKVNLNNYNAQITAFHNPPGNVIEWHTAKPATKTNKITDPTNYNVKNGDKLYAIITYNVIGGDTAEIDFTINPKPIITFPDIPVTCQGTTAFQISGVTPTGGVFSGTNVSSSGIFNPVQPGSFYIKYTSTTAAGCVDTLSKVATVKPNPTVNAGQDQTLCNNITNLSLTGSSTNSTGLIWSGGTGTFSNLNSSTTTYTPSSKDLSSSSITLTLTANGVAPCTPVNDQVVINFATIPVVDAGQDQIKCTTNSIFNLTATTNGINGKWSGGSGTFSNPNSPSSSYTPATSEAGIGNITLTYTVSASNPVCPGNSDQLQISVVKQPTVDAGQDQSLCNNNSVITLQGSSTNSASIQWSGGTGSFSSSNNLTTTYSPSLTEQNAGTYTLTLTANGNTPCTAISDKVTISFAKPVTVNAGPDQTFCSDISTIALTGSGTNYNSVTWSGGSGTFTSSASGATTYTPSAGEKASGSTTLTLTANANAPCPSLSDDIKITYIQTPTINAGNPQTLCADATSIALNAIGTNYASITWSGGNGNFAPNNSVNSSYTPTTTEKNAGSVTLTIKAEGNAPCKAVTGNVKISFTPIPTVKAGPGQQVCETTPTVTLNGSGTNYSSLSWTGGTGTFSNSNSGSTTYSPSTAEKGSGSVKLIITALGNSPCSAVSDALTITFDPAPTVDPGAPQAVCSNNIKITLNGSIKNATSASWTGGLGTFTPSANSLNASYNPTQAEIANGSITLTLTTVKNSTCDIAKAPVTITITQPPIVKAGPPISICQNITSVQLNGSVQGSTNYVWSTEGSGSFSPSTTILNPQYFLNSQDFQKGVNLVLTATASNCLPVSDKLKITVNPLPAVDLGPDLQSCEGTSVTVKTQGIPNATYSWTQDGNVLNENSNSHTYTSSTGTVRFIVKVMDENQCSNIDSVKVSTIPLPKVTVNSISICQNDNGTLSGTIVNTNDIAAYNPIISWSKDNKDLGVSVNTINVKDKGIYTFSVNASGCIGSGNGNVDYYPSPILDLPGQIKFCIDNDKIVLLDGGKGFTDYLWEPGNRTTDTMSTSTAGVYTLTVSNQYNCKTSDQLLVREVCPPRLFVGDAFTPDSDGVNDFYNVYGAHIGKFHMLIFNRWGEIIFESYDRHKNWDGIYREEPMPIGVYPWIITYEGDTDEFKGPYKLEGSVTVIR
jgi:gliding motility-associated-like protein